MIEVTSVVLCCCLTETGAEDKNQLAGKEDRK